MFIRRNKELNQLKKLWSKDRRISVVFGRKSLGKTSFVKEFIRENKYQEVIVYGTMDKVKVSHRNLKSVLNTQFSKLNHQLKILNYNNKEVSSAKEFLSVLKEEVLLKSKKGQTVLFLDEISQIAPYSEDFLKELGLFFDSLEDNKNVMILISGSVPLWIKENILEKELGGKINLVIELQEILLQDFISIFPEKMESEEKFKYLCAFGCIPKYYDYVDFKLSFSENIKNLAFSRDGYLFNEFDNVFHGSLSTGSGKYKEIVEILSSGKKTYKEIQEQLMIKNQTTKEDKKIDSILSELEVSGFISKDKILDIKGNDGKSSFYRLKDNFIRFYLLMIEPVKDKILFGQEVLEDVEKISHLQLINLIYNNMDLISSILGIEGAISGPMHQNETKTKKELSFDLIMKAEDLYLFEIVAKKIVGLDSCESISLKEEKVSKKEKPRKILIFKGEMTPSMIKDYDKYYNRVIDFLSLLKKDKLG